MLRRTLIISLPLLLSFWIIFSKASPIDPDVELPQRTDSVRFAVIGDNGTGERPQYEVAKEMEASHRKFAFSFVIMLGDNIYGSKSGTAFKRKFEEPYAPLLKDNVKFYASLGNHDLPNEIYYKPFNMEGHRFYSFRVGNAEFFVLDSNYMDPAQLDWLRVKLHESPAQWKICYFHHPLYSDAGFHGPDLDLRKRLEPVFQENGVNVVFNGHEHVYERLKPQNGINYFVLGNSGELRLHDLHAAAEMEKGFDTDNAFMLAEIAGDELFFQVISRAGKTVDSGVVKRQKSP
jgi:hypothetical protein